ncbi:hypothetical protein OG625_25270 [Streptomyces sp. NBC_01351]|uniref:hypothetical protein n=1 Tax=Streptomyces sp. NBC_01351 TaxID=2903833 RepID=UPI002E329C6E|nr:hypothetical protein [Streptomyces sp. NBC_01351]
MASSRPGSAPDSLPDSLREQQLRGVAANPAAPPDVLIRLLDPAARAAWTTLCEERDLPPAVVEAVLAHPEHTVRRAFARNPHADPAQRGRLVHDPDGRVRGTLAGGPRRTHHRIRPLPDEVLETLLTAVDGPGDNDWLTAGEIAQELESSRQIPLSFRLRLPEHPHPVLRARGTDQWKHLTTGQREALLADPDPGVREAAARAHRYLDAEAMEADLPERDCHARAGLLANYPVTRAVVEACLAAGRNHYGLAHNLHTPADAVARLARDPDPEVRNQVAARADLTPGLLAELAEDPDEKVRSRARIQPLPRTWAQCRAIDALIDWDTTYPDPELDADWYAACARSEHPVLRRLAARHPGLPRELVEPLITDPDPEVRHALALHHPLAPPALVLDTFLSRPGERPYLLTLPDLPRTGLGHLLGHEDPEVRALAAADVTLDEPPVRLLSDPEALVRRAAAANPLLPLDVLLPLLEDPEHAEGAAANPGLPAARLHELLDLLGVPAGHVVYGTLDSEDNSPVT